ncbi:hypothetical protein [Krasilnikovia sp. M28-CT-15]|uniref:hypothetical protein n=1 Tax=Krasilnikovia sp. M28-CT-15 TaxID=3373540 RepID=UPI003876D104
MAKVVCVHGIRQQLKGPYQLRQQWTPALRDGLRATGEEGRRAADGMADADVQYAFYGDAFRAPGQHLGVGDAIVTPEDLTTYEREMLALWFAEAQRTDPSLVGQADETLTRTPTTVQGMLRLLSGLRYFESRAPDRLMLGDLVQVRRFFTEEEVRGTAVRSVVECIDEDTRVVIGHSLGSVVAYEALCQLGSGGPVSVFVTLGSPLGIRGLIFDRLRPPPEPDGNGGPIGRWPGGVSSWVNVADEGDVVALEKNLSVRFGSRVESWLVKHGVKAHDIEPYLSSRECGEGILRGLVGGTRSS